MHKGELIYLEKPVLAIPPKKSKHGATTAKKKADRPGLRIDEYCRNLHENQWDIVEVRKTAKGLKFVLVHTAAVWHWDGEEEKPRARTLVITRTLEKNPKVKFSFSNGTIIQYSSEEYACFQCNRYWVEQCFDDAKNELGLSGYQVRKWLARHHHQSLVMIACLYFPLLTQLFLKSKWRIKQEKGGRTMNR